MPDVEQELRITVVFEEDETTRQKTYTDHTKFLHDLREWRQYAEAHDLRFSEQTETTIRLGAPEGPLFS
jgi:hypothetical protein